MSDKAITLGSERSVSLGREWNRLQRRAALQLSLGYNQSQVSRIENIPLRTLQRWVAEGLEDFADELHQTGWERVDPMLWANLEHALQLQQLVFAGQMAADDPRYLEARRFIDRALSYRAAQPRNDQSGRFASSEDSG